MALGNLLAEEELGNGYLLDNGGYNSNLPLQASSVTATNGLGTSYSETLTPVAVAADTSAEQTFTVTGLVTGQTVVVNGPAPTAGTGIVNARVSAANTLALTFANFTAASLTPTSGTYLVTQL